MKILKVILLICLLNVELQAQNVKNFTLKSVTDNTIFTLSKSKGKFVALHFLLKTACPYCIRHTSEYFEKANTLPNVVQIFIKPDNEQEIKQWANKLKSNNTLPVYQDIDGKLADQFNIPSGYQFHGQVVHYPALILLNAKGEEVFRYIGKNNTDRFSFDKLKMKFEEFKENK